MLTILYEEDDPELMDRVFSFRHQRFVEHMGWQELRRSDQREKDQYDGADVLHAVLIHEHQVIGYSRLLPTTSPHFVGDYSQLDAEALPCGPEIFEWSRCATLPCAPFVKGMAASDLLMTGVLECLIRIGARAIVFLTYPPLVMMMRQRGYPVQVLADISLNAERVQVVFSTLPEDLLARHRESYSIQGSLLSFRTKLEMGWRKRGS